MKERKKERKKERERETDKQTFLPVVYVGKNKGSQNVVETSETGCQLRNKTLT